MNAVAVGNARAARPLLWPSAHSGRTLSKSVRKSEKRFIVVQESSPSSTCTWNTVCAATAPPSLVLLRVSHRGTRAVSAGLALRKRFALALSTRGLAALPFDA